MRSGESDYSRKRKGCVIETSPGKKLYGMIRSIYKYKLYTYLFTVLEGILPFVTARRKYYAVANFPSASLMTKS